MNQQPLLRQHIKADQNRMIHIQLPEDMANDVDILIVPSNKEQLPKDSLVMAKLFEETAFARNVLDNPDEDCWNEL